MKKTAFLIALSMFILTCQKENVKIEYPKVFNYNSHSFVGEVETYNSNGISINVSPSFEKQDFLFTKDLGIYPIDRIDLITETEAKFYFSDNNTDFTKQGPYNFKDSIIHFEIYFENSNNDTLFLTALYQENTKLTFEAYGFKTYGPNVDNNGQIISSRNNFGEPLIDDLLKNVNSTDTLYIQRFNEIYIMQK